MQASWVVSDVKTLSEPSEGLSFPSIGRCVSFYRAMLAAILSGDRWKNLCISSDAHVRATHLVLEGVPAFLVLVQQSP